MIRYNYNQQIVPPAPFVHVTLVCHETGKAVADIPGQLDCAADRTVIPGALAAQLGLVPLDEVSVSGLADRSFSCRPIVSSWRSAGCSR
jgi:hypothetical protein